MNIRQINVVDLPITVRFPVSYSIANEGPSVETSHLYWPVLLSVRPVSRMEFSLIAFFCWDRKWRVKKYWTWRWFRFRVMSGMEFVKNERLCEFRIIKTMESKKWSSCTWKRYQKSLSWSSEGQKNLLFKEKRQRNFPLVSHSIQVFSILYNQNWIKNRDPTALTRSGEHEKLSAPYIISFSMDF